MDEQARRLGLNEALFREVNERIESINESFGGLEDAEFLCECADHGCAERIAMAMADYGALRTEPTHFAVRPGHEIPDVERVVERHEGYVVVAKRRGEPAAVAEATDPRS